MIEATKLFVYLIVWTLFYFKISFLRIANKVVLVFFFPNFEIFPSIFSVSPVWHSPLYCLMKERGLVIQWVTEKGRKKIRHAPLSLSLSLFILYFHLLFFFITFSHSALFFSLSVSLWCWYLASLEYFVRAQLNGRS